MGSANAPLVDRRLFVGLVFVIGVQGLVWLAVGVMWFGAGGTTQDYFAVVFFGVVLAVPVVVAAFVIGLGLGVALWIGMMAVCKRTHLSERQSAIIAAPTVASAVSAACLFATIYGISENPKINSDIALSAIAFSIPSAIAAGIYANCAWPKTKEFQENDK